MSLNAVMDEYKTVAPSLQIFSQRKNISIIPSVTHIPDFLLMLQERKCIFCSTQGNICMMQLFLYVLIIDYPGRIQ